MQTSVTLLPGVENRRVGRVAGDDGLERLVRSFHFRVRSVKCGGRATARTRTDYVLRRGEYEKDGDDVEAAAGDLDRLLDAADRIEATSRIKKGPTAERILVSFVQELPAESTAAKRAEAAAAVVEHWRTYHGEDRPGHEAIAVVHVHGAEKAQAHLHIEVAARPILPDGTVDRSVRLWTDPSPSEAVRRERKAMSDLVNRTCEPKIEFHAGTFGEIGREDEGKPRLPISKWRALRKEIAEAGDAEEAAEIERRYYALERDRRDELRQAGLARKEKIDELKELGDWRGGKPIGQRERLERRAADAEAAEGKLRSVALGQSVGVAEFEELAERYVAALGEAEGGRDEYREHFAAALRGWATAGERTKEALDLRDAEAAERIAAEGEVRDLTEKQTAFLTERHEKAGRELPDLTTGEGQADAWRFVREQMAAADAALERERAREEEERRKKKEAATKRQALLADNPYGDTPERELRRGFRADRKEIEWRRGVLARPSAVNVHEKTREEIEALQTRNAQRREAAALRGIELVKGQGPPSPEGLER